MEDNQPTKKSHKWIETLILMVLSAIAGVLLLALGKLALFIINL